jgi:ADP-heptose:LPS heptosyltransferase
VSSRWPARLAIATRALARTKAKERPTDPAEILVVATLLIGDALLLAPLLAKLRARYPRAKLRMTMSPPVVPLFAGRPYGVEARGFSPRDARTVAGPADWPAPDLAFVPGDNRNSWLAAALGARWIVAFDGDRPAYKSWAVDERVAFPSGPAAWHDIAAMLVDGPAPAPYRAGDWPAVPCAPYERPTGRYAVLHVEASTPHKHWPEAKWLELATLLAKEGLLPVWSAGPAGLDLIKRIDAAGRYPAIGHRLDLAQLWNLIAGAGLLVCPDTGTSHMGKLTGTPTVTLYGPGSAPLFGRGAFWREAPFREVVDRDLPPREQQTLFKRPLAWLGAAEPEARTVAARDALDAARQIL